MSRRRLLPLLLGAGISTLLIFFVFFQDVSWSALPQAVGLGKKNGPSQEDIATGKNILPDLRNSTPDPKKPDTDETTRKQLHENIGTG
jgi:hypothetical protein